MSKEPTAAESRAWVASIPQAVRTVNLSVLISLLSLVISLFTLFWSVRPARVSATMSAVYASNEGGAHVSIPLSIVNTGARPAAVLAAKLIESDSGHDFLWGADFTVDPDHAIPVMTGSVTPFNAALWVPFQVPGNGQIERVFVFRPADDRAASVIKSRRTVSYRVVMLLSGNTEVTAATAVTWPLITNGVMATKKGGVGSFGTDLDRWFSARPPSP
jgi:hypothetical protein